jgi:3-hydroxyacyl-[acyl-carrier-protein] dehydratase
MDVREIQAILPHRFPLLLVDRVEELVVGERIRAVKSVSIGEPFFQGHFPGDPVMPGVLVLEALAQASAILGLRSLPPSQGARTVLLMGIDGARFRRPVVPGDRLLLEARILRLKSNVVKTAARATVDGELAAEAEFLAMLADRPQPAKAP